MVWHAKQRRGWHERPTMHVQRARTFVREKERKKWRKSKIMCRHLKHWIYCTHYYAKDVSLIRIRVVHGGKKCTINFLLICLYWVMIMTPPVKQSATRNEERKIYKKRKNFTPVCAICVVRVLSEWMVFFRILFWNRIVTLFTKIIFRHRLWLGAHIVANISL